MKILGIETSCDETAASVVENGTKILSSVIASSSNIHAKTGGIIPETAARKQVEYILPVIEQSLYEAFCTSEKVESNKKLNSKSLLKKNIDAIAVTFGPGLIGSLLVGIETAKTLSFVSDIPLIPVNHIIAHTYGCFITDHKGKVIKKDIPNFPAINLIVSGGHTELLLMKDHNKFIFLGGTRDDAAGEAFDKVSRIIGLSYPGGPAISQKAERYLEKTKDLDLNTFPRPMIYSNDYDFSFSGLKTSIKNYLKQKSHFDVEIIAAEIQEAIVDSLIEKTYRACKEYKPKSLLLAGGVAANKRLRYKIRQRIKVENMDIVFHVPEPLLCTDNAVITASCAYFHQNIISWRKLKVNPEASFKDL